MKIYISEIPNFGNRKVCARSCSHTNHGFGSRVADCVYAGFSRYNGISERVIINGQTTYITQLRSITRDHVEYSN